MVIKSDAEGPLVVSVTGQRLVKVTRRRPPAPAKDEGPEPKPEPSESGLVGTRSRPSSPPTGTRGASVGAARPPGLTSEAEATPADAAPQALVLLPHVAGDLAAIAPELEQARAYAAASKADETRRAYTREWTLFASWCSSKGLAELPAAPVTVAAYLAALADGSGTPRGRARKPAGLELALAAIAGAHKAAGFLSPRDAPEVRAVRAGIRRTVGVAQRQVDPLLVPELRRAVAALPDTLLGLRDRALLLVGWAGSFRRSALVSFDVPDLAFGPDGLELHLRRDKTDQEGKGRTLPIPFASAAEVCPVLSLRAWLDAAGITEGPVFRSVDKAGHVSAERLCDRAVALVVKRAATSIDVDPEAFAGHSLRAGFATSAIRAGRHYRDVMRHTGHRDVRVFDKYVRAADLWRDNPAAGLL
jgi:integrase